MVKLELPGKFDGKPVALNTSLFDSKQYLFIVVTNNITDMVKLAVSCYEKDAHTQRCQLTAKSMDYELGHLEWHQIKMEIEGAFIDVCKGLT